MSDGAGKDDGRDTNADEDDYNDGERDRRAIDEEDDEEFMEELNQLARDVSSEYASFLSR